MADSLLVDRIARQRGPSLAAWANGRIGSASARPPPLVGWCRRRFGRSARAGRSPLGKSVPPDRDERQRNGNREATLCARAQGMETLMRRKMLILTSSLIFFLFAPLALGTCAANWTATGSLNIARGELHITAKLLDGRVLYAGGDFPGRSAEVYDPTIGTFTLTGNMTTPRNNVNITALLTGKVLVSGGYPNTSSAELYDPATGTFSPTGSMSEGRRNHEAILLQNGKALVFGGSECCYIPRNSAELYDPLTQVFTRTGNLNAFRENPAVELLSSGKVLVAGGSDQIAPGTVLSSAEVYDPATGLWSLVGSMTMPRGVASATLLTNGKVLVAGGSSATQVLATAELFDPSTGTFTATGSMSTPRTLHAAVRLQDGRVLVAGGINASGYLASAEVYDPSTGTFSPVSSMITARGGIGAVLLNNGRVLYAGGGSNEPNIDSRGDTRLAELFTAEVANTPGKVTGGGYIQPDGTMTPATLLIQSGVNASVGDKATFGFGVQFAAGDTNPTGNLQYNDHAGNVTITAVSFTLLNIGAGVCGPNTHAKIQGSAAVTGPSGGPSTQDFEAEVDDCGSPSSTPPDTFKITTTGPTSYMAMGPVVGGNITIRKQ